MNVATFVLLTLAFLASFGFAPSGATHHPVDARVFSPAFPPTRPNATLAGKYSANGVNIYSYYSAEPAPMGIADYGIGPNGPYVYTTTQFKGEVIVYNLSAVSSLNTPCVSFQLNVVLNYQYGGNTYALWVQDVAVYDTFNRTIWFLDNVWNFTSPNAYVTGLYGNGNIYATNTTTYYAYVPGALPGNYYQLSLPFTFYLLLNVTTNSLGQPVIYFWYNDGFGWVNFDTVTVANVQYATNVYFLVDGYQYTGSGHFYDAELIMGGPGGGSSADIISSSTYFALFYWNGNDFQEVENAYNFGSDTAETVSNALVQTYYYPFSGELLSGITAGIGTLGSLWDSNTVGVLTVETGVQSGYVVVYNDTYPYSPSYLSYAVPFVGGSATFTLVPMDYAVLVYNSQGQLIGEANVYLYQGESISTPVTQFSLSAPSTLSETSFTFSIPITIYAYGNVSLYVEAPGVLSYSLPSQVEVEGESTQYLVVTVPKAGTYYITVTATLFPGFSVSRSIEVVVTQPTVPVSFNYQVVGQPPITSPTVTLQFPNGTIVTLPMPVTLNVPIGTSYSVQQIVGSSQGIRWALQSPVEGNITTGGTIDVVYYEQYLVTFEFSVQGGEGYGNPTVTFKYFGVETEATVPATVWVDYDSPYSYSQTLPNSNSQQRWIAYEYEGVITSPGTVSVFYNYELYVTVVSPIPVYALVNGTNTTLTSGWYVLGTTIRVENLTYYVSPTERYVIVSVSPSEEVTVTSPLSLGVSVVKQFYVSVVSPIPVYALINGTNTTLSSGWYNAGSKVLVENLTYYPSPGTREVIVQLSPQSFTLTAPETVVVKAITQYYVNLTSVVPVHALVNGSNVTLASGWYNKGTSIYVENLTYYPVPNVRYVIASVLPSDKVIVESPLNLRVNAVKQYYVEVVSQIPVYALINGTNETFTSGWYNSGTEVRVENLTYYLSPQERLVPTSISPSAFNVESPTTVRVSTVKQYLVTINGVSSWYDQGSTVTLTANVPIYEVGRFVGTDNVSPGATLVVNGPIEETLVVSPNYPFFGVVGALVAVAIGVVLLTTRRPK